MKNKELCKGMIRQAVEQFRWYNKYNVATKAEKRLIIDGMEAVLDYLPVDMYTRHNMREYVVSMMEKILDTIVKE